MVIVIEKRLSMESHLNLQLRLTIKKASIPTIRSILILPNPVLQANLVTVVIGSIAVFSVVGASLVVVDYVLIAIVVVVRLRQCHQQGLVETHHDGNQHLSVTIVGLGSHGTDETGVVLPHGVDVEMQVMAHRHFQLTQKVVHCIIGLVGSVMEHRRPLRLDFLLHQLLHLIERANSCT
ncbi:Tat pathway signal sequence, partial [Colletotrichum asianum]